MPQGTMMTPIMIEILLQIHYRPEPTINVSEASSDSINKLLAFGLIEYQPKHRKAITDLKITSKGTEHVHGLCMLPFPVVVWKSPANSLTPSEEM
jgi:hypothetical protein